VPMVEADPGLYVGGHQGVDEAIVKFQSFVVWPASSLGQDAGPGGRQAIRADAQLAHQRHVLRPTMIVVAGDVAGVAVEHLAGEMAERVPDRGSTLVLGDGALDLVGRRRGAPQKTVGKTARHGAILQVPSEVFMMPYPEAQA